ncbi:MAG: flavin reductase family protein [Ruminococcaceae bacterium]|nr:flavin reductase family protein [Oscillospiraceae bacterium]
MEKIKFRAGALLAPVPPVMVSCGSGASANIITVAWTGILNTVPPKTYISVRQKRHSYGLIKESGEFVLNLTPASLVRTADFCGMYTGAKVDKFEKCRLTKQAVEEVGTPLIAECPISLCCRVSEIVPLGSHDMFIADVVAVYANEELLDGAGKLHVERADLCAYAHGEYFSLGKRLGSFGFSARKKPKKQRKPHERS